MCLWQILKAEPCINHNIHIDMIEQGRSSLERKGEGLCISLWYRVVLIEDGALAVDRKVQSISLRLLLLRKIGGGAYSNINVGQWNHYCILRRVFTANANNTRRNVHKSVSDTSEAYFSNHIIQFSIRRRNTNVSPSVLFSATIS